MAPNDEIRPCAEIDVDTASDQAAEGSVDFQTIANAGQVVSRMTTTGEACVFPFWHEGIPPMLQGFENIRMFQRSRCLELVCSNHV